MDTASIQEMITTLQAQISAVNATILSLLSKQQKEYLEDTGQGRIRVIRQSIKELNDIRQDLVNELCMYQNRLNGGGSVTLKPGW
jgi:hypothetical protein